MKRRELDILYVATRVVLLFWVPLFISDLPLYLEYARRALPGGQIPYVHFDVEYPPLAYLLMVVPGWLHDRLGLPGDESYRVLFGACLLPFDFLLFARFRRRPPVRGAAFLYVLLTCALGLLLFDRFDLVVGFLLAWPFLGPKPAGDARFAWCWGVGGALKLVPLALAPVRALEWCGPRRERAVRLAKFAALTAAPLGLTGAAVALATGGKLSFISHHADRGVQIESLLGSGVLFLQVFAGLFRTKVEWNFGAQHLAPIPGLVTASRVLFFGSLLGTYGLLATPRFRRDSLSGAWLLLSGIVTFNYVLSPQFLLWIVPLGLCAAGQVEAGARRSLWLGLFAAVIGITGTHFRYYWLYVNLHQPAVALLFVRNALLAGLWGLSWVWMGRTVGAKLRSEEPRRGNNPMNAQEAHELVKQGKAILVDVREESELRETGTAEGARWMPLSAMAEDSEQWRAFRQSLPRDRMVILFCKLGGRSGRMGEILACEGYQTVNLGGFSDWTRAGLPVKPWAA